MKWVSKNEGFYYYKDAMPRDSKENRVLPQLLRHQRLGRPLSKVMILLSNKTKVSFYVSNTDEFCDVSLRVNKLCCRFLIVKIKSLITLTLFITIFEVLI